MKNKSISPLYIKHRVTNVVSVTKIIMMHLLEMEKDFDFHTEKHDFWEMLYIDAGQAEVVLKNETHSLSQGDVFFVKPNMPHKLCGNKSSNFNAYIISFTTNSASMNYLANKKYNTPVSLRKYISLIINEGNNAFVVQKNKPDVTQLELNKDIPIGSVQMIRCYIEQFLIMLLRGSENKFPNLFSNKENMENHIIISVKKLLNQNLYSNIGVDEICQTLHYSRTYISNMFKKYCGTTINTYYNNLKITEAKNLIDKDIYSFTQISEMLGFNNPHYFTRVFKRVTNMTPTEYQNSSRIK